MWITITTDDVKTRLAGAEFAAYTQRALSEGQVDPLPDITAQVVREVRGHVAGGGNTVGDGLTVPDELLAAAVDMIVFRLTTRLGIPVKEDRRTANDQAKTLMGQVGRGEFKVAPPESAAETQAGSVKPGITPRTKVFTLEDQDGL
jgi:NAD(P)H-hydrate repair Nnr-like enzyme with NAD(P)H-hydrate epimerase domain